MTDATTPAQGLLNVGEQATPPFAVLPDSGSVFKSRASRLSARAQGHDLEPYLRFVAQLSEAQHRAALKLAATPNAPIEGVDLAISHAMAPLAAQKTKSSADARAAIATVLSELATDGLPESTLQILRALQAADADEIDKIALQILDPQFVATGEDIVKGVLAFAGLQVHFARLASTLPAARLSSVASGACPSCASLPVSSTIVTWPRASNTRFCTCSLCATMWNVVRVKCVLCNETGGISYRAIDGQTASVKAECCEACRAYVKVLNQTQEPALEAVADDIATLGLDMLMREEGWRRGARNPLLMGY